VQVLHLPAAGLAEWLAPGNLQFPFQLSLSQVGAPDVGPL
jgi:hypothetical protein